MLRVFSTSLASETRCLIAASIAVLPAACLPACAAEYIITASGPIATVSGFSDTYNGTDHGELPSLLDVDQLTGGTFNASFRFSTVVPPGGGQAMVLYDLSAPLAGMNFDLFGPGGQLVHHGSDPFGAEAIVLNNSGAAPFTVDQVLVDSFVANVTGSHFPSPIYSPAGEIFSIADFSCFSYVDGSVNFLNDLSIPIDAATYLAFPNKNFDVYMSFGDGDIVNFADAYQYVETVLAYNITSLSITAVPEPTLASLILPAMSFVSLRRRRSNDTRRP